MRQILAYDKQKIPKAKSFFLIFKIIQHHE